MRKLLNFVAGFLIPIRITSRLYLANRLASYGVDVKRLPEACLQELADDILLAVRGIAKSSRRSWREIVTDQLDGAAANVSAMLLGEEPVDRSLMFADYLDHFTAILRKHGVSVPL